MDFERILSVASALEPEKAPVRPICVLAGKFILFHLAEVSHVLGDTQVPSPAFWGRGGLRGCRWEEAEAGGHVVPARGMRKSRESQIPDLLSTGEYSRFVQQPPTGPTDLCRVWVPSRLLPAYVYCQRFSTRCVARVCACTCRLYRLTRTPGPRDLACRHRASRELAWSR